MKKVKSTKNIFLFILTKRFLGLETLSSKSSVSIGELKESFEKYSDKIRGCLLDLGNCSPENQVKASTYIEKYLSDFKEAFELDERVSQNDDMFIETLRSYPQGSIASHYAELWDTINGLEALNLSSPELLLYIDSAILSFSREFVDSNHREFATEMADEVIAPCMIGGFCETFNRAMDKLNDLQSNPSVKNSKSRDSSDEEEVRKIKS